MRLALNYVFIFSGCVFIQHAVAQCNINQVTSFQHGEKIQFKAYYHLLWDTYAADVQFSVSEKVVRDEPVYFFNASGTTIKKFDWIYKVSDSFQSCVSKKTLNPYWASRQTLEGSYFAKENYKFVSNGTKIQTEVQNSDHSFKRDSLTVNSCVFDVLTLVYYCRTIDFSKSKKNDKIPVSLVVDGNIYPIYIRYHKKEVVKNQFDDKKYRCIFLSVLCLKGSIFDGGENLKIWVTDDDNKLPIKIQAKILIGTVFGYLSEMEGLRNKVNAVVN